MKQKIKIGVSSCLIGEKVRWNGDHKQNHYVREVLGHYFEYVPVCPEVEVGMGTPRETVALYGPRENPKMISRKSHIDWTSPMRHYIKNRIPELNKEDLCGYIFKSKSPSCGLARIPVYSDFTHQKARHGAGLFADAFKTKYPWVPTEDEGRLNDFKIRENFLVRVFCFHRWQRLLKEGFSIKTLVDFHTRHKFLLLSHSRKYYDALGKLVANAKSFKKRELQDQYVSLFMEALTYKSTPKKNTDVLLHMLGFFKKQLQKNEKENILKVIEDYRNELIPLIVPVSLMRHMVTIHNIKYLQDQVYLNPHPKELMLRNHV